MNQIMNDPNSLKNLYGVIGQMITATTVQIGEVYGYIEKEKSSGNLEPENYAQLMSSEYLGGEFQQEFHNAYSEQTVKMQQFLLELEKKLNEYLQIS